MASLSGGAELRELRRQAEALREANRAFDRGVRRRGLDPVALLVILFMTAAAVVLVLIT